MIDKTLEKIKELYKLAGMKDKFDEDLEQGVIAKIKTDDKKLPYSKYAKAYTSTCTIDSCEYQYYIFKPGYSYRNGKLYFQIKNKTCEIKNDNFDNNLNK